MALFMCLKFFVGAARKPDGDLQLKINFYGIDPHRTAAPAVASHILGHAVRGAQRAIEDRLGHRRFVAAEMRHLLRGMRRIKRLPLHRRP